MRAGARAMRSAVLWPAVVGVGAGFLSGLFGVGGGILIVPGLVLVLGMDHRRAHGTSLAAIVPIAVFGVVGYAIDGAVDWAAGALLGGGAVAGAVFGTHLLGRVPERGLRLLFSVVLVISAVLLPLQATRTGQPESVALTTALALLAVGVLAGVMGGLLGVGGGIVMVPALVLMLASPQAVAKGTSLAAIVPAALVGTARNARGGRTDLRMAAVVGVAGMASAFGASRLAIRLDPVVSAVLFGMLLVAVAVRLLLAARGRPVPGERSRE